MPRLGIVSDTHIGNARTALPPALLDGLACVDAILHAGDLVDRSLLLALGRIAPIY